jgi:hypothetical protein
MSKSLTATPIHPSLTELISVTNNRFVTHSYTESINCNLLAELTKHHNHITNTPISIRASVVDFSTWLEKQGDWQSFVSDHVLLAYNSVLGISLISGRVVDTDTYGEVIEDTTNNSATNLTLYVSSSPYLVNKFIDTIKDSFVVVPSTIKWVYSTNGDAVHIPLNTDKFPVAEMYPFLKYPLLEYYDRYNESSSSILLLIGPPGTGKTSFIRGFLNTYEHNAIVTYDAEILKKDYIFAEFLDSSINAMVIEDADVFLKPRDNGDSNSMMHKFLSVGDGLVTIKNKKIIFSTNLPSIDEVDQALIRKGRCFDVVHFRALTGAEASVLATETGHPIPSDLTRSYTIADILNPEEQSTQPIRRTVGFI